MNPTGIGRRGFLAGLAAVPWLKGKEMNANLPSAFPTLRVTGASHAEIGAKIGGHFRDRVRGALAARRAWVEKLEAFVAADRRARYDGFLRAARDEFPHLVEELRGCAEGAGVPFERMFTVALNPELGAMMRSAEPAKECTTVALVGDGRLWVGHNEDGASAYRDFMYLLDVTWPSGVRSWSLCYPGYFPGNGPSVNSAGVAQTVNFISGAEVRPGVPRYVLDRAGIEARDLDAALRIAVHPRRSYAQHHLFASADEGRALGIEVTAGRDSVLELAGLYVHANHLVHERMRGQPEFIGRPDTSRPRQRVAASWAASVQDPAALRAEDLLTPLRSHEGAPLSVCRHPAPGLSGSTLGAVLVRGRERRLTFFELEPCGGREREVDWPRP